MAGNVIVGRDQSEAPERSFREPSPWKRALTPSNSILGYLLVAPVVAILIITMVYPFFFAVWISFTDRMVGREANFIFLENYRYLLNTPSFRAALRNSVVYVGSVQVFKLVLGLGVASLLNQPIRGRNLWRGMILLPWAMPGFVAFIVWRLMYAPQGGALNMLAISMGLTSTHINFLSDPSLAMPSVIVATVWRGFPFWVILFLAAMQTVDRELYEAASIDGANPWQQFRNVTLPGIRHVVLVVILLSTIWTANSFEAVWLTTQGGPSNATIIIPVLAYFGLQNLRIGQAAAVSTSLVPIFLLGIWYIVKQLQKDL